MQLDYKDIIIKQGSTWAEDRESGEGDQPEPGAVR